MTCAMFQTPWSYRLCAIQLLAALTAASAQDIGPTAKGTASRHVELRTERQRWDALNEARRLSQKAEKYEKQGKSQEAEQMALRALATEEQVRGPWHIELAHRLDQVADLYVAHKNDRAAAPLYERARAIRERALSTHPDVYEQDGGELRVQRKQPADKVDDTARPISATPGPNK